MSAAPFAQWPGDDDPTPRVFRKGHSLFDEAVAMSAAAARDTLSPRSVSALIEGARARGLTEELAIEAVGAGLATAEGAETVLPPELQTQVDEIEAQFAHSRLVDDVLNTAALVGFDALYRSPEIRARYFGQEVAGAMRRGLSLPEALAIVRAGFVEAAEETAR